jgi:adenylate cyclase
MQRRLAAILAADVVGYSRMLEADEAATLAALKDRRKRILEPLVSKHHGRVVKLMGDGVLIEFGSAVEAVQCAVDLQEAMSKANEGLSAEKAILLRIGVNLGDVVIEGGDLFGDGVNVAARLEGLADPGGICVSAPVRNEVHGRLSIEFEDTGEVTLKNLARAVHVFRIGGAGLAGNIDRAQHTELSEPAIAVLPFVNMSGDPEQEYFSDGITEDIITELSRFRNLHVIARNSSFQFRGKSVDVKRIGRELGVQYLVEGSVRRSGGRVRITAQLIETETGSHIWAERFDRKLEDIFELQDEVTQSIVAALPRRMESATLERSRRKPAARLSAYEYVLRAEWLWWYRDAGQEQVLSLLDEAIKADPGYARAYARAALVLVYGRFERPTATDEPVRKALCYAERAMALDYADARVQALAGQVYLTCAQHDLAEIHSAAAVALNPNDAEALYRRGLALTYLGDPAEGLTYLRRAVRLDPLMHSGHREVLFDAHYMARDYSSAMQVYREWPNPPFHMLPVKAACYAQMGRLEDAREAAAEFNRNRPSNFDLAEYIRTHVAMCRLTSDREHWLEGYRKAGLLS